VKWKWRRHDGVLKKNKEKDITKALKPSAKHKKWKGENLCNIDLCVHDKKKKQVFMIM